MLKQCAITLACLVWAAPALAQASASVSMPGIKGHVETGANAGRQEEQRTSDASPRQNCHTRGVTVRSADGSVSSSASASGGEVAVAGAGSPGSRTRYFGCEQPNHTGE